MGHLIPMAELAKLLVARHGFSITIITLAVSASKGQATLLSSLPDSVSSLALALAPVPLHDLPPDAHIETTMAVAMVRSLPSLRDALSRLRSSDNLVAFVADIFGTDAFDVSRELGVPPSSSTSPSS
ncbi:hypothetical protein BHM03_00023684 [Ensete ventricosum]|nr:hypothetical protein BHM03_00023684 [Ensete ventricosum]